MVNDQPISFDSIKSASEYFQVSYSNAMSRLNSGKTPEQAFELEIFNRTNRTPIKVYERGSVNHFESIADAARYYGIDRKIAAKRIKNGWTVEEALGIHPPKKAHSHKIVITQNGKKFVFNSIAEAAIEFNQKKDTVASRLRKGWSPEEALGIIDKPIN
ncbi:NUMOD1 domain-containing DNA-binding protein [Colwellia sp. 20A7]|uniref:NUMOD1 domain-containing DNA-binding protein n=1 Tax=Colwellia sp. 20A7 TaxID=2689569 RepID=UPI0013596D04|nr:NUMOD1 domain-containing DNA-binding protein [Colwellia sp. 20A7]